MEVDQTNLSLNRDTELIIPNPRILINNRYRQLLGLPKRIDGEHVDNEQYSWCRLIIPSPSSTFCVCLASNTLLCACIFLEDAVNYRSIVHKVTRFSMYIYRWFSCPLIRKYRGMNYQLIC